MSLKETLSAKLSAITNAELNYVETNDITQASNMHADGTGLYMEATVAFFEIKNLRVLIKDNGRRRVAQIYNMYHDVLAAFAEANGGFINCYSSESFLLVFPGKEDTMSKAVTTAWKIIYAIKESFKEAFEHVTGLEFAIGMDHGHIMGTKTLSDNGLEHLSWFGSCICKAQKISRECARPYYVGISSIIYHNLGNDMHITHRRILGIRKTVEIWSKASYLYENEKKHLYQTNHKINFEES